MSTTMHFLFAAPALAGIALASPYNAADYIMAGINLGPQRNGTTASTISTIPATSSTIMVPSISATASATSSGPTTTSSSIEPCLQVAQIVLAQTDDLKIVDPDLALSCLRSVPLQREADIIQLAGVSILSQFQSTLAYLQSPPEGYLYPAVDVMGSFDEMLELLNNNEHGYTNEYDFQLDLYDLVQSGYDEHFVYGADILGVLTFRRNATLFSISDDTLSLPEVYLSSTGDDILSTLLNDDYYNITEDISPVAQINGVEVETWLNTYATIEGRGQDPDNNYNQIFRSIADLPSSGQQDGLFTFSPHYQGAETIVTLRNGTDITIENYASTRLDWTDVVDGLTFFEQFCTPSPTRSDDPATSSTTATPVIPTTEVPFLAVPSQTADLGPDYYPIPYIVNDDWSVAGYFSTDDDEVAILTIQSFEPSHDVQFSNVVRQFLATAAAANKTKLIVDLRGNPGGDVPLAYDTLAQLYPSILPYGATNFRATPLLNDLGMIVSNEYANVTNATPPDNSCDTLFVVPPFSYEDEYDMDENRFESWQSFYGPYEHNGDNFTALTRFELDDKFSISCSNISNHRNLSNITPQVFLPEDTLIIQDGFCASTCAVFSEFMKDQAGVKSVVFGGRKQFGPMQGVGGVKGANVYKMATIAQIYIDILENEATPAQQAQLLDTYGNLTIPMSVALARAKDASVNVRNNIRLGDESVTPLQFVYEAADCRLFYTADMLMQQSLVWQAAHDVYWGDAPCVQGSTNQPSSGLSVDNTTPDSAFNFFDASVDSSYPTDLGNVTTYSNATTTTRVAASSPTGSPSSPVVAASVSPSVAPYRGAATSVKLSSGLMGLVGIAVAFAALL